MSELKLSVPLIQSIQKLLEDADAQAADELISAQYLAAVMGYLVAKRDMPSAGRREAMDELFNFARYVLEDVERQSQPAEAAFGIWKPGDS